MEEMCLRLQQKEQIIQELLRDRSRQAVEQETELQELLQAVSIREQQNHVRRAAVQCGQHLFCDLDVNFFQAVPAMFLIIVAQD